MKVVIYCDLDDNASVPAWTVVLGRYIFCCCLKMYVVLEKFE